MLFALTMAEELRNALVVTVIGMGIVFFALGLIGELFEWLGRAMQPAVKPPPPAPVVDDRLMAVLTAAVVMVMKQPTRILHIRTVHHEGDTAWMQQGRQDLQSHHEPHRDNP